MTIARMFVFPSLPRPTVVIVLLLLLAVAAWLLATLYTKSSFCHVNSTDGPSIEPPKKLHRNSIAGPGVDCEPNVPCSYPESVDFRVIVITFNRAVSVMKLLRSLDTVEMDGDSARLEIWIDRDRKGGVDNATLFSARQFRWSRGPTRVHVQKRRVGIYGQWIDTWAPTNHTRESKEICVILEDDLTVSLYIYRWLKAVHRHYGRSPEFLGATLNSDEQVSHDGSFRKLVAPKEHSVFMYKCMGSWGMSTTPYYWHGFQLWYHMTVKERPDFRPYVRGIQATTWYKSFEANGTADSMWTMWFVYFAIVERLFTVYNNLPAYNADNRSCLIVNRREVGLHYLTKGREDICALIDRWSDAYTVFPKEIVRLDWNGTRITMY